MMVHLGFAKDARQGFLTDNCWHRPRENGRRGVLRHLSLPARLCACATACSRRSPASSFSSRSPWPPFASGVRRAARQGVAASGSGCGLVHDFGHPCRPCHPCRFRGGALPSCPSEQRHKLIKSPQKTSSIIKFQIPVHKNSTSSNFCH